MSGFYEGGIPLWVIADDGRQVVGYLAEGTETSAPVLEDGRGLRDVPLEERWDYPRTSIRRRWLRTDVVMIFPRGRRHSLWVMRERGKLVGWYINLETPHVFRERTISTADGILDLWIDAETGEPAWKDEEEFAAAVRAGYLSDTEAVALRAEGERLLAQRPWPTGWEDWVPPSGWVPPTLPDDWTEIP